MTKIYSVTVISTMIYLYHLNSASIDSSHLTHLQNYAAEKLVLLLDQRPYQSFLVLDR
jgi:hypothetical protein